MIKSWQGMTKADGLLEDTLGYTSKSVKHITNSCQYEIVVDVYISISQSCYHVTWTINVLVNSTYPLPLIFRTSAVLLETTV